jgi:FlgD Ig-like domain
VTVALLLAGTAGGMVLTQHLRHDGPVASSIHWKTRPGPRYRVCFRLTRDDTVQVAVVDPSERVVRVLASEQPLEGDDTAHCFAWDGRDAAGQPVAPGVYRLQLSLEDADRVAVSGERLTLPAAGATS